jgi:hypothetical protein
MQVAVVESRADRFAIQINFLCSGRTHGFDFRTCTQTHNLIL